MSVNGTALRSRIGVLVTGAAGLIGSHLARALAGLGADVVALDDLSHGDWANLDEHERIDRRTASVLDRAALDEAMAGCERVFHLGALGSVPKSLLEPEHFYRVNVMGTVSVPESARAAGVSRVIYAASSSAYGDPPRGDTAKIETMTPAPLSPYAASRLAGEQAMAAWANCFAPDTVALRYFNVFGPRQNANSDCAAVIAAFARALFQGEPARIFGDGEQSRDFSHVDNVVHANLLAARCDRPLRGWAINTACGRRVTVNALFDRIKQIAGPTDRHPGHLPPRAGDVRHSLASIDRAQQRLGYAPIGMISGARHERPLHQLVGLQIVGTTKYAKYAKGVG
ncbi:MAG: NAD-dependent epimerase/dehydratase family protein [Alphaproteobacteria bacterium]|jgi:UDP-glucose 4-epimerase|nr:NAD-dependent epimerase/dehydratase family protein [Alphaproteobacteria bacterium]